MTAPACPVYTRVLRTVMLEFALFLWLSANFIWCVGELCAAGDDGAVSHNS
jgi:hypothetical protein